MCERILKAVSRLDNGQKGKKRSKKRQKKSAQSGYYAPEKYLEGLTDEERDERLEELARGSKTDSDDPSAYDDSRFKTDFDSKTGKRKKTKQSKYTKQFYELYPGATSLEEKAEATGVPLDILQQVYDRGLAAYRTGHRPGATQGQWASARVHSFLVKGCTFYFPDHKLAAQAIERSKAAREHFDNVQCLCHKGCKSGSRNYK